MSFLNFASTFRDQASAKAKEAAQKLQTLPTSLPTFDDMAQNDDYIHSEEFNVRGEPKKWKKKNNDGDDNNNTPPSKLLQSPYSNQFSGLDEEGAEVPAGRVGGGGGTRSIVSSSSSPSSDSNHVPETVSMSIGFGGDEASACTTESSWSLLDRATGAAAAAAAQQAAGGGGGGSTWSYVNEAQDRSAASSRHDGVSSSGGTTSSTTASLKKSGRRSPTTPLLSVVADTLQQQPQSENQNTPNRSNRAIRGDTGTTMPDLRCDQDSLQQVPTPTSSLARMHEHFDDDDDDDHGDDPIFSLLKKESMYDRDSNSKESALNSNDDDRNQKQLLVSSSTHSTGHRFLDDLEKRMNSSDQNIESFVISSTDDNTGEKSRQHQQSTSTTPSTGPFKNGPFGGYFMNLAVSNANKIFLHRPSTTTSAGGNVKSPPLARTKKTKSNIQNKDDDEIEYNVTASTSVLSASELKQLKESSAAINNGMGKLSIGTMYDALYSNRRFVFIFGTFILTLIVYWYLSQTVRSNLQ